VALFGTVFFGYLSGHTFEAALIHTAPYAMGAGLPRADRWTVAV